MGVIRGRLPGQNVNGVLCVAWNDCFVVSIKLCERFLNKGSPESTVVTDFCIDRPSVFLERQLVINRDCRWNAQDVELEAVDAIATEAIVEKNSFKSARLLSNSWSPMHEPAIPNLTLKDVMRLNTCPAEEWVLIITVQRVNTVDKGNSCSLCHEISRCVRWMFLVPDHSFSWECLVFVLQGTWLNPVEYILRAFDSIVGLQAIVTRQLGFELHRSRTAK